MRKEVVLSRQGAVVCERCLVADSLFSRLRGLLGRRELPRGEGLLIHRTFSIHMFFMRFPIDAVFLDAEGTVLEVVERLRPWRVAGCRGGKAVLELPAGEAEQRGIRPGDSLEEQVASGDGPRVLPKSAPSAPRLGHKA